jgi:hypothetical protein
MHLIEQPYLQHAETELSSDALQRMKRFFRLFQLARGIVTPPLNVEDTLALLALGSLCANASMNTVTLQPVACVTVAETLCVSRETARRRMGNLGDRGLALVTSRGILLRDAVQWWKLLKCWSGEGAVPPSSKFCATDKSKPDGFAVGVANMPQPPEGRLT